MAMIDAATKVFAKTARRLRQGARGKSTAAADQGSRERVIPLDEVGGLGRWFPVYQMLYGAPATTEYSYEKYGREQGVARVVTMKGKEILQIYNQDDLKYVYHNEGKNPRGIQGPSMERYWANKGGESKENLPLSLFLKGDNWRYARKILNPGINSDAVAKYEQGVYKAASGAIRHIKHYEGTELGKWAQRAAFDLFCGLAIGKSLETVDPACPSPMKEIVDLEAETISLALRVDFLPAIFAPRDGFEKLTAAYDRIVEITGVEVRELFAQEEIPACWFKDLRDEQNVTVQQLEDLMAFSFSVAVGTTTLVLQWALIALAFHPDEQAKVYQEICANLSEVDSYSKAGAKMPQLEAFLRETNRVYPPLTGAGPRVLEHDIVLPHSRVHVPAGTLMFMTNTLESRDTQLNADAGEFRADRFLRENMRASRGCPMAAKLTSALTKDPFGNGTRVCLGKRAAELEVRMLLCELLKKYELVLDPADQPIPGPVKNSMFRDPDRFPSIALVPR